MTNNILLAGFGGQGIQFAGKQLASAGMAFGKEVSFLPAYGPESRGGTSYCSVIISDEPVGSPIVNKPDILAVFNAPSFEKFEPAVKTDGIIFSDSSLINRTSERGDISAYYVPATQLAVDNGLDGFANVIMLAKIVYETKLFDPDAFLNNMIEHIPASKAALIDKNKRAYNIGISFK